MVDFSRRAFLSMSGGGLSVLAHPVSALAQATCSMMPPFLPNQLTVDCASRQNFQLYRKNAPYLGLTGVVNMSFASGSTARMRPEA